MWPWSTLEKMAFIRGSVGSQGHSTSTFKTPGRGPRGEKQRPPANIWVAHIFFLLLFGSWNWHATLPTLSLDTVMWVLTNKHIQPGSHIRVQTSSTTPRCPLTAPLQPTSSPHRQWPATTTLFSRMEWATFRSRTAAQADISGAKW